MTINYHRHPLTLQITVPYKEVPFAEKVDYYRRKYQEKRIQTRQFARKILAQREARLLNRHAAEALLWNA